MTLHGGWPVKTPPSILTVLQSAALPFIMVVFRCSNDRFESLELFDKKRRLKPISALH